MGRPKLNRPPKPKLTLTPSLNTCNNIKEMCASQQITVTEWFETRVEKEYKKYLKAKKLPRVADGQIDIFDKSKAD